MSRVVILGMVLVGLIWVSAGTIAEDRKSGELLRAGKNKENVEQDPEGAIALYQQAFNEAGSSRAPAAKALVRIGAAYKKLRDYTRARETLRRVETGYADQIDAAKEARAVLEAMGPAATVPPPSLQPRRLLTGNDADPEAFITFDGRFLSRTDWETGDLAIRDMSTGIVKPLKAKVGTWETSNEVALNPIVSPDGRQVAFVWVPDDGENWELRVMAAEPKARAITLESRSSAYCCLEPIGWSPDSSSVFVLVSKPDRTWQFARISLTNPQLKPFASLGWRLRDDRPSLSPDGAYVAYSALTTNPEAALGRNQKPSASVSPNRSIYILRTDGAGGELEVGGTSGVNASPIWTPDGKQILFVNDRSGTYALYSVAVENGKPVGSPSKVPVDISHRILPVGMTQTGSLRYVVDEPTVFDIFMAELDTASGKVRGPAQRVVDAQAGWNRAPAWSPDGRSIAFKRRRDRNSNIFDLVVYSLETRQERTYTYSPNDASAPVWFHDNKSLLVRRNQGASRLSRLALDTGEFRYVEAITNTTLPDEILSAMLSPDDKTLYMTVASVRPAASVVAMDMATGMKKTIWSSEGALNTAPTFAISPDGKTLAATVFRVGQSNRQLIRMASDGSGVTVLAENVSPRMFTWSKDSRAVFFLPAGSKEPEIMRVLAAGGVPPTATGLKLNDSCGCGHSIDFNPVGSKIVFSDSARKDSVLWTIDSVPAILKIDGHR